jgi:hypothetical protein
MNLPATVLRKQRASMCSAASHEPIGTPSNVPTHNYPRRVRAVGMVRSAPKAQITRENLDEAALQVKLDLLASEACAPPPPYPSLVPPHAHGL